jgi:hypothetical protein
MSSPDLPPLPDLSDCGIENWNVVMLEGLLKTYGKACAAAEREAAARICEKYFHSTCARVIRAMGEA